jgi:sulfate adenylyltransferase subunit 1
MTELNDPDLLDHGVLRFLTAGSVDDGKSTLIGRLLYDTKAILADQLAAIERTSQRRGAPLDLSLLTDGLTAEREQGITIDVAYRYFATGLRKFIIADAPGHEQYTRNMVTAASTANLAVLLVDARHGIVTQTRRHATIAHRVGIPHLVVAVNKMDLVDWREDVFRRICDDFDAFARRTGIDGVRYVPMSAFHGDMVVERGDRLRWYQGPTLLSILETAEVEETLASQPFRFPVQLVGRPSGGVPRRYLGRVESGTVAVGDPVDVLPSGRRSRIREIRTHEGSEVRAGLHASVALVLEDDIDVSRGDMIVRAGEGPPVSQRIAADICWLGDAPLDPRRTYALRHTTREVRARIEGIDALWNVATQSDDAPPATLATNDIARVRFQLAQPICADAYATLRPTGAFVLVDEATNNTIAAGMVATADARTEARP